MQSQLGISLLIVTASFELFLKWKVWQTVPSAGSIAPKFHSYASNAIGLFAVCASLAEIRHMAQKIVVMILFIYVMFSVILLQNQ